ncbi:glycosyltransferase family 4 protein [Erythrobacter tepidarius]|uniref:glycosyltransferase family 4 protein n=1 Tax=Erythrobacter tepidarius TaxID=60454 RepID=UPI000A3A7274|nr:glycosyltransferase family 1 protein [Erythrobacter tepidarius]
MKGVRVPSAPRIAVDCRYVGPRPSGIGECVAALARHLPELAPDCEFIFLRNALHDRPLSGAANVHERVVGSPANGPLTLLHLPLAVDLRGIDLFHAPANLLPGGLTMPAITTVHDVMWLTHPKWCNSSLWGHVERRFYGHGIRRALARSALVATVSEASRAAICAVAPEVAGRVVVTLSGVAEDFRPLPRDEAALARIGVPRGKRFVLVVGQGAPYKNHEGALRAFALAFGAEPGIDLVVVRRRERTRPALERLADRLGIGGRVHFLPALDRSALVQLYCGAAMLLHPSFIEGFGNPLAEAMACGCPVVTSDCSAMPEVTAGAALLANPHDPGALAAALRKVADAPALAAELRRRGLARAAELDWRAFAAANLALYRRVLAGAA